MVEMRGRPLKSDLFVGAARIQAPALFREDNPNALRDDRLGVPVVELSGMSAFDGQDIVLDLRRGQERFGLLQSP